jgi:hypothetical protein
VHLPRSLQQRLQARHLLLQVDCFAIAGKLNSSRHCASPPVESHSSMKATALALIAPAAAAVFAFPAISVANGKPAH